ncbi:methyl-CpG-binding protein 2 [Procambarus clarkii]|uniref:methyl-CpG-binding protein 2 n=1 Tax=Procambarus clarkii TaxID=6728 RepID=UPI001E6744E0|nr:methyl-CpG-binding protein 2-like [Procambarus clarkii]XP_045593797.1 methyl-CpG-binding protein 2-like [Procambarus clarkii]XP_045593807.1 methyl-CpG-binding protein 2-like [Procambarus clarkii]
MGFVVQEGDEITEISHGWRRLVRKRKSGASIGRIDHYYLSPDNKKFKTKKASLAYAEKKAMAINKNEIHFGKLCKIENSSEDKDNKSQRTQPSRNKDNKLQKSTRPTKDKDSKVIIKKSPKKKQIKRKRLN